MCNNYIYWCNTKHKRNAGFNLVQNQGSNRMHETLGCFFIFQTAYLVITYVYIFIQTNHAQHYCNPNARRSLVVALLVFYSRQQLCGTYASRC